MRFIENALRGSRDFYGNVVNSAIPLVKTELMRVVISNRPDYALKSADRNAIIFFLIGWALQTSQFFEHLGCYAGTHAVRPYRTFSVYIARRAVANGGCRRTACILWTLLYAHNYLARINAYIGSVRRVNHPHQLELLEALEDRWRVSKISLQVPIRSYNGELMHWRCSYISTLQYLLKLAFRAGRPGSLALVYLQSRFIFCWDWGLQFQRLLEFWGFVSGQFEDGWIAEVFVLGDCIHKCLMLDWIAWCAHWSSNILMLATEWCKHTYAQKEFDCRSHVCVPH